LNTPKRKSAKRFEQVNLLCDQVVRNLDTPLHALVLLIGWRHANERCVFRKSANELAKFAGVSKRHMQNVLDDLIKAGAIKVVKERQGTIPTSYLITGKPRPLRGEPHFTPKENLEVNCSTARGEL
jgi:hypothetical protein